MQCVKGQPAPGDHSFFETKIRPVLATKCYGCHSSKLRAPMASLVVDTKDGMRKGGATGAGIVPGKPEDSRIFQAITFQDPHVQMPPQGKLPDAVIADFKAWIAAGAVDPRTAPPATAAGAAGGASSGPLKGMSVEEGRKWWAFQAVTPLAAPAVSDSKWPSRKVDHFILASLDAKGLKPSPQADKRTLAVRVYLDLAGYKPTYQEIEAFASDPDPKAYENLVERLLAAPSYGERWGRHWMDVARFGEDNPTGEATNPPFPYAWRYRDWVIEAMNRDIPYDKFVTLQLAADHIAGTPRGDLRALGYLGAAPVYHKDLRLSGDVIGGFLTDDFDERVDSLTRGVLGLTVACARCHDHKFDPIPTKDYYGLVGVFASTMRAERPLFEVDAAVEQRYMWLQRRLFDLRYSADLLTGEPTTVVGSEERVARWKKEIEELKAEGLALEAKYPKLTESIKRYWTYNPPRTEEQKKAAPPRDRRGRMLTSNEPFFQSVYDAAQYIDASDKQFTVIQYKPGEARDFPVLRAGNVASPGEVVPRHFPLVLAKGEANFQKGSGRLELAQKIFTDAAPLSARVIVNRVWGWHFGKPLAATPSDFGVQGEKPSHPDLLTDLAARFVENGWSLKWLHREILMSSAYRQSSKPREDGLKADVTNVLLWRMNPRRLEVEAYRDTLLRAAGRLDTTMYGASRDLGEAENVRRTVYGRVSRSRLNSLLKNYDFPDAMQPASTRDLTTTPLQQLFVMNSEFVTQSAAALGTKLPEGPNRLRDLFRQVLSRDPSPKELDLAQTYLSTPGATFERYAQVLLSTNEVIFWP